MAPSSSKRKRPDRQLSTEDTSGRPSPHRPENLSLAQQGQSSSRGGRATRRQSKQNAPASPAAGVNSTPVTKVASPSPMPAPPARDTPGVESSRPATPSQPAQPAASTAPEEKEESRQYLFEVVTDDRIEAWQDTGRQEVLEASKLLDDEGVGALVQELVRSALDKRLNATEAGTVIRQMIADREGAGAVDVQSLFLNTISMLDDADTKSADLLTLVAATDIDPEVIRVELDIPLLQTLSLVRSTFMQMRTRKTTNILYRQANFNLLREESEGYAKLVTEYFNTANEAVNNHDVSAEAAFQRVKALVGSFDLDVGRVLDITLDISANLLVRAYGFFVQFYRCSSWWPDSGVVDQVQYEDQGFGAFPRFALPESERPKLSAADEIARLKEDAAELATLKQARDVKFWQRARDTGNTAFYELGARKITNMDAVADLLNTEIESEYDSRQKEVNGDRRKRMNENRKFMRDTGLLPPPGNSDAAQLLGFKLRFYASDARDPGDVLPENLIYLAALLIKIGFISLRDLYPHLYPADEKMPEEKIRLEREKMEKEAKERPGGGPNALAMAGALTDDTISPAIRNLRGDKGTSGGSTPKTDKKEDDAKEELPAPSNQKIMLLKALLLIGALPEALYILGLFPWLMEVETSLPPYLHRVVKQMLSKVADSVRPLGDRPDTAQMRDDLETTLARPDGTLLFRPKEAKKVTKWLGLDAVEKRDGQMYRHYYADWDQNIPVCQDVEDVFTLCNTFLNLLGVRIGQDAGTYSTLLRIAKHSLATDASDFNRTRWLDLMKRLLVPALSLSKHNVGLTQEVYELLKFYPTATRYNIYAEWYLGRTSRTPEMKSAHDHNRAEVRDVLRRVTNENGKKQARALAKVSLASPGVVTMSMISQLENYSNMIPSLVECTRYFSLLAYDVLTWNLIYALGGQVRNRMQDDGMLTSPWLQYLSQFVASLFFRYTVINPSPVLQYLAFDLRRSNSTNLELFDQVLAEMAGIRSDMEFNDAQVIAMGGGEHLQAQTVMQLADKRYERKTSAQRLIKALSGPGLIGQMLIAIAQERQKYAYAEEFKFMPLKVLGNNLDKIQQVFAQYLDVLKVNLSPEDFEAAVPDVVTLVGDYGLEPGMAFTVGRTAIAGRIAEYDAKEKEEAEEKKRRLSSGKAEGDVDMVEAGEKPAVNGELATSNGNDEESKAAGTPQTSQHTNGDAASPWHPVLEPIIDDLPKVSPELAERVSVPFFVSFWTLTLQDILVSSESYKAEIKRLEEQVRMLNMDRSNLSALAIKERDQQKKDMRRLQDKLSAEVKGRVGLYQKTKMRLEKLEKKHWFSRSRDKADVDTRHIGLLQECFLPRAMLSSLDAHYSFLILKMLHGFGTPGFSTMHLLNQLMRKHELAAIMFQCTAMEAQHFGRFLCETLKLLHGWHADKTVYEKEALGFGNKKIQLHGFVKKFDANGDPETYLEYEDYRRLLFNWHTHLTGALQLCFESGEYMHIRNGIIVLKSVVAVFPALNFQGINMVKHVTTISQEDPRQDLKLAAMSLLGPLRNREKSWIMPQAFRLSDASKEASKGGSRAASARPETPQPAAGTPKLSATAPEFKPPSVNGAIKRESVAGKEDGEIDDEKQAATKNVDVATPDAASEPKVSEVLEKAEIKQESKAASSQTQTAAPLPTKPSAADPDRSSRPPSTQPSRHPHDLPSRPESRAPSKPLPAPPSNDRPSGRYDSRGDDRYGRLDRPNDMRPGSRGHSPEGRSRARTPERDPYYGSQSASRSVRREERGPTRGTGAPEARHPREDERSRRDAPPMSSRPSYDSRDRMNGSMGPPSSHGPHPERAAYLNNGLPTPAQGSITHISRPHTPAESIVPSQSPSDYGENPARLALINNDHNGSRDPQKDRPTPNDRSSSDASANGFRGNAADAHTDSPSRMGPPPTDAAPTGPRRNRSSRDLSAAGASESSYGRLNGAHDAPSGPRPMPSGPGGRPSRSSLNGPLQGPASSRANEVPMPSPSTRRPPLETASAPRGPGGSRQQPDRRSSSGHFEQHATTQSSTPQIEAGPAIHPERVALLNARQPPPIQTNVPPEGPRNAASPNAGPPSGPRGPHRPAPSGRGMSSPASAVPPAGPATAQERARRTQRQHADINATISHSGAGNGTAPPSQGVSFRGAAQNRQPSMSMASSPSVPAVASSMEPPTRPNGQSSRPDATPDLFQGRSDRPDERSRRHDAGGTERQRGSRHSSRERRAYEDQNQRPPHGMDDRSARNNGRDDRRPREERDAAGRDSRGPRQEDRRRPPHEAQGPFGEGPNPPQWPQDDRRGPRGGPLAAEDVRRGGRGSGRAEDFRGDQRRQQAPLPGPRDEGRKRRHEDGPGYDDSKRRRGER